jgi:hypothetical protein
MISDERLITPLAVSTSGTALWFVVASVYSVTLRLPAICSHVAQDTQQFTTQGLRVVHPEDRMRIANQTVLGGLTTHFFGQEAVGCQLKDMRGIGIGRRSA